MGERRRFRVPYEWILGAMFVGSFYFLPWDDSCFIGRAVWLVVVGPLAGLALGVEYRRYDPPPRVGALLWTAVAGWVYCASVVLLPEAKNTFPGKRDILEEAIERLLSLWAVPLAPSLLGMIVAGLMPRRYRESVVFANAAFLLVFAFGCHATLLEPPEPLVVLREYSGGSDADP